MNHMNDANECSSAVHDRRGTAYDLDPIDVGQIECRKVRVEGSSPGDAIDDQQEGIEFAQAPHFWNAACGAAVAAWRDRHTGDGHQSTLQVASIAGLQVVAVDHGHCRWNYGHIFGDSSCS